MCGITGIYSFKNNLNWENTKLNSDLNRMTSLLAHRGPDSYGYYKDNFVGFGHRRLSIIDQSINANQPLSLGSPPKTIIFNGEIYNYQQLKSELISKGFQFKSNSDTEVILNCYLNWGLNGLKKLEGIFAFSIWDAENKQLILMRDRLGIKPLFYANTNYGLAFGSEIKSIIAAGGVDVSFSDQSFSEYLWFGTSYEERTFFNGVKTLEPGEWIIIKDNQIIKEKWWAIENWLEDSKSFDNSKEAQINLEEILYKAVNRQLISDSQVGVFLSGGVDSSAVASNAAKASKYPIKSYCAGFDFMEQKNEFQKAENVAKFLGLKHSNVFVSGKNLEEIIIKLAQSHDQPFADAANIPIYLMCKEISNKHKVVLQGDGGDELFGGYRKYLGIKYRKLLKIIPRGLISNFNRFGSLGKRINRFDECLRYSKDGEILAFLSTIETLGNRPEKLLKKDNMMHLIENTDPFLVYKKASDRFKEYSLLQKAFITDLITELPYIFLSKVDIASMAASVEARVPLLDDLVVKLAINLPNSLKISGVNGKFILKKSLQRTIPKNILNLPKTGFGVPYGNWLKHTIFDFTSERILDDSFLNYFSFEKKLVEEKLYELKKSNKNKFIIWKLLQLSLSKSWIDQN